MVKKILTLVTLASIVTSAIGCAGPSRCLFGRGARCGLCSKIGAINPFSGPAAYAPAPYAVAPCETCPSGPVYAQGPMIGGPSIGHSMGSAPCETCHESGGYAVGMGGEATCGYEGGVIYGDSMHGGGTVYGGSSDPYLNGSSIPFQPSNQGMQGMQSMPGDNFNARRFDSSGDRIISQDPLPPGAQLSL